MSKEKPTSVVARLKQLAMQQKRAPIVVKAADWLVIQCPQCGAGRTKSDGITRCGYCGHVFTTAELSDGIHIKQNDNSR